MPNEFFKIQWYRRRSFMILVFGLAWLFVALVLRFFFSDVWQMIAKLLFLPLFAIIAVPGCGVGGADADAGGGGVGLSVIVCNSYDNF